MFERRSHALDLPGGKPEAVRLCPPTGNGTSDFSCDPPRLTFIQLEVVGDFQREVQRGRPVIDVDGRRQNPGFDVDGNRVEVVGR